MQTESPAVHEIILQQLGGRRFLAMTGCKNLVYSAKDNNWLSMKLTRNKAGANFLKIILTGNDWYTMIFSRTKKKYETIQGHKFCTSETQETVRSIGGVYADQLEAIFTEVTGLYTHL